MRKIVVLSFISLDGVMQAPGGSDEDRAEGFEYGGWTAPYFDEFMGKTMGGQMTPPFDILLGRKTYGLFASFWPHQPKEKGGDIFGKAKKYVVTNNSIDLTWDDSVQIEGDVVAKIKELKEQDGPILQVHGSGKLTQTLLKNDLVDELWLKTFPVTIGKGKKLFAEGTVPAAFELIKAEFSPSGVVVASYKRAGELKTGSMS